MFDEVLPRIALKQVDDKVLEPRCLFSRAFERHALEIGFGAGEHLAWQARNDPDCGFIGVEYFEGGIGTLLSTLFAEHLEADAEALNVRIHQGDARGVVSALPDGCLDRVFILFPDPWPKSRHHKRRLVSTEFLGDLARVIRDEGLLRFASDDQSYVSWSLERLAAHPEFEWTARGPDDWRNDGTRRPRDWPSTRYERKAARAGKPAFLLAFRRRPRRPGS